MRKESTKERNARKSYMDKHKRPKRSYSQCKKLVDLQIYEPGHDFNMQLITFALDRNFSSYAKDLVG